MPDELEELAMDEDAFADALTPRATLPADAARAAGWGVLALFAVLGVIVWRKTRR
ncbi:MAG TPA: hypothetical protein PK322_03980 [Opitutaceae bacterium]|nr:hypothetical protein [Opitutaceae bacterium]